MSQIFKQLIYPSTGECLIKLWYRYTTEYYIPVKRHEALVEATTWKHLKGFLKSQIIFTQIILNEKSNLKDYTLHDFIYITFLKWQIIEIKRRLVVFIGLRNGRIVGEAIEGPHEGSLKWWKCSVFWLYQCHYLGCDIVLYSCKMLPLGGTG